MKTINNVALLTVLGLLVGCASAPPIVTGTEGASTEAVQSVMRDADGDGIADDIDACEDSDARALVDRMGCKLDMGAIQGLNFEPGEVSLSADAEAVLDRYIDTLQRYPEVVVAVEGHTDNRGAAARNLELSKERVLTVVRYMVAKGVGSDRIMPYGYGESRPRSANATAEGREQNRRIEIKVVEGLL